MSRISLKAYNQEIEGLIDAHQFDQAVAHAQYILRYYPKHIDTYRLLGKAFLESQRYGDAADIFQRVLSSIPDDFVSHVGMSIIREDEGNLNEAIWHMERAFDVQPANSAIQRELSRLYGKRDGLEPPKVRLTRGALARIYIKGELYPQAINEIRAALKNSPQRYDLLVLLAQAHFRAGQRFEAAEVCSKLLKALPYCLEANYILGEVLANSERAIEAKTFQRRAQALNPYLAHLSPNAPVAEMVPDSAVVIEKMIWTPGEAPQQPAWAASLGVDLEEDTAAIDESLPDWLADEEVTPAQTQQMESISLMDTAVQKYASEELPGQDYSEGEIPEWMQEAGWTQAGETAGDQASYSSNEDQDLQGDELAPADMPEWLQEIAPGEGREEPEFLAEDTIAPEIEAPKPKSTGSLPWIEDVSPEESGTESDTLAIWLEEKETPVTGGLQMVQPDESVELPEWLQGMADESGRETGDITPQAEEISQESLEWAMEAGELPEKEIVEDKALIEDKALLASLETADLDGDEALAWLENLAEKQGVSDGLLLTPEERRETPPDWAQVMPEGADTTLAEKTPPSIASDEWVLEGEIDYSDPETPQEPVAYAVEPGGEELPLPIDEETFTAEMAAGELPDWLSEAVTEESESFAQVSEKSESPLPDWLQPDYTEASRDISQAEGMPDWLKQADTEMEVEPVQELVDLQSDQVDESYQEEEEAEKESEVFSMLFGPAEFQPPETGEVAQPLIIEESPIIEGDTTPVSVPARDYAPEAAESLAVDESEGIPEWLEGLEAEIAPPIQAEVTEELRSHPETAETMGAEKMDEEAAFAWLEGLAARQGVDETLLLQPEERTEEVPDWVVHAMEEEAEPIAGETAPEEVFPIEEAIIAEVDYQLPEQAEQIESEITIPELPTWLADLEQEIEPGAEIAWQPPEEAPGQEVPAQEVEIPLEKPLLNINEAGLVDLERLPGIGFIKAQAILEYREQHGNFSGIDDLQNVPGLGPSIIDNIRDLITVWAPEEVEALKPLSEDQIALLQARNALVSGDIHQTVAFYTNLIQAEKMLPEVINDLNEALYRFPVEVSLWEALGDAYFRADQLQEALDSYIKAEELLR